MKFSQNFAGISQNFSNLNANFDEPDNFRKMRKFCRKFAAYFWQAGSLQNYPPPRGVADINLNSPGMAHGLRPAQDELHRGDLLREDHVANL